MQTISTLSEVSQNPEILLATGIARTVNALGHNTALLRERILGLIAGKIVLTSDELTLIQDALTSQKGGEVIKLVNYRLFCDFMDKRSHQDTELGEVVTSGMEEFQIGGEDRYDELLALAETMKKHAQHKKDEPGKIHAQEIWKYIQMSQKESIQKRNNSRFQESCLAEKSRTLHAWNRTESAIDRHGIRIDRSYTLELRYDLDNNLLGGWDSRGEIIGDRVLSGFRPIDELPPFFSDEYILPCRDNEDKLNLVEFRPDNYATYSATEPQHFSITKPEKIIEHGSLQSVDGREIDYYLINERHTHRLLHSAFDQGMRSDEPIQTIDVDGDRLFIGNSGDYYVGRTTIISLGTGGMASFRNRDMLSYDGQILDKKNNGGINGYLYTGKESLEWKLPVWIELFGGKTIPIIELQKIWKKLAQKARRKTK